jgi:ATP-dependent DNA ligase
VKKVTLYAISSTGKPKQWSIWTEGGYVFQEWGFTGGKLTSTKDLVKQKNIGKANETSLEEQAKLEAQRKLSKKKEEGYSESLSTSNVSEIDWKNAILPDTFAPSKPETSITPEDEETLVKSGNAIYQRKHNGMRAFVIRGENSVNIYSRRLELKTDNFPEHIEAYKDILPSNSIVDCECVANDDPDLIKTIFGTHPEKAIERQKNQQVTFIIFDVLHWNDEDVTQLSYTNRMLLLKNENFADHLVTVVKNIEKPKKIPKDWEGLILRDRTSPMKIRWDGKPDRKSGSWKIKNFKECDLVCYEWMTGKGKLNDSVATLKLGAYDDDGKLVHICESGSGLTDEIREEILKLSPPNKFVNFTVEIKYEEKIEKSGSLRLPIFLKIRTDKSPKECLLKDIK